MLINKKAVKIYLKGKGKNVSESTYPALEGKVRGILDRAAKASSKFKRVEARDIIIA